MPTTRTMELTEAEVAAVIAARQGSGVQGEGKRVLIGFVIDEWGSMGDCVRDTIGGYNAYLEAQAKEPGVCLTSRLFFSGGRNSAPSALAPLAAAGRLTAENYRPGGGTPLWDAVGQMFVFLKEQEQSTDMVLLVVLTDGEENESREYTKERIAQLRAEQEATGRWTVVFMGADFDAAAEARSVGVGAGNTFNYQKTETAAAYQGLSVASAGARADYLQHGVTQDANFGKKAREHADAVELKLKEYPSHRWGGKDELKK